MAISLRGVVRSEIGKSPFFIPGRATPDSTNQPASSEPASPSPPPSPGATPYDPIVISDSDLSMEENGSSEGSSSEPEGGF